MSRGPGRMMRAVLSYLHEEAHHRAYDRENWISAYLIAWCITRDEWQTRESREWNSWTDDPIEPAVSCMESVRRAIKTLVRDGRVETTQRWHYDRRHHARDNGLHCRLTAVEYHSLNVGQQPTLSHTESGVLVGQLAGALTSISGA